MKAIIAGGGTGGHLFPALAVAGVLHARERGHETVILISPKEVDALATRDHAEFHFEKLPGIGMPKIFSLKFFSFLKRMNESISMCRALYKRFQPRCRAPVSAGSPRPRLILAAANVRRAVVRPRVGMRFPVAGRTASERAAIASGVLLGFEECAQFFPKAKCQVTGTPIPPQPRRGGARASRRLAAFSASTRRAKRFSSWVAARARMASTNWMIKAVPALKNHGLQIIHLTGSRDTQLVETNYRREEIPCHVAAFCHRMEDAYSVADVAVARSGAASLAELFGTSACPNILIPYPHADRGPSDAQRKDLRVKPAAAIVAAGIQTRHARESGKALILSLLGNSTFAGKNVRLLCAVSRRMPPPRGSPSCWRRAAGTPLPEAVRPAMTARKICRLPPATSRLSGAFLPENS